jgi:hypothetical protein
MYEPILVMLGTCEDSINVHSGIWEIGPNMFQCFSVESFPVSAQQNVVLPFVVALCLSAASPLPLRFEHTPSRAITTLRTPRPFSTPAV